MKYLSLFFDFFKISLFTFGGGLSMLKYFEEVLADKKQYLTREQLYDIFTIAQCTPGAIAINVASYVGFIKLGIIGAIIATIAVILPSVFIISLIAIYFDNFMTISIFKSIFQSIKIMTFALISYSFYSLSQNAKFRLYQIMIIALMALIFYFGKIHVAIIIISFVLYALISVVKKYGFN